MLQRRRLLIASALAGLGASVQAATSVYALNLHFTDDHGTPRELAEWQGRAVILTMGYGACRSICSSTLRTLEELMHRPGRRHAAGLGAVPQGAQAGAHELELSHWQPGRHAAPGAISRAALLALRRAPDARLQDRAIGGRRQHRRRSRLGPARQQPAFLTRAFIPMRLDTDRPPAVP